MVYIAIHAWFLYGMLRWAEMSGVYQNVSKDVLLTGAKIQAKILSPSGDCVLGEGQLHTLPLMVKD